MMVMIIVMSTNTHTAAAMSRCRDIRTPNKTNTEIQSFVQKSKRKQHEIDCSIDIQRMDMFCSHLGSKNHWFTTTVETIEVLEVC